METGANKHIQIKWQLGNENFFIAKTRKNVDDDNDTNYFFWNRENYVNDVFIQIIKCFQEKACQCNLP